ncbi:MAG TPA: ABC transporter permease [Anaerolineales bacterium]|nr:ABC transporter permease [Anaerolineales bacterium]
MPHLARYLFRRTGLAVITLIGVVIFVFLLTHVLPSNPAALRAGPLADAELIHQYEQQMGLDQPIYVQFYRYARELLSGNLGESWKTGQPVLKELGQRLPATLELATTAFLMALAIGLTLGILAAVFTGSWVDQGVRLYATLGAAQALFWLALLSVHVFYYTLRWAPPPLDRLTIGVAEPPAVTGFYTIDSLLAGQLTTFVDAVRHLWLPAAVLAFVVSAPIVKMTRGSMLDALNSDFVRTARAVGVPRRNVVLIDGLRNAFIPILTMIGIVFGYLIAGNVVVEKVFSWAGIGQYAWNALTINDFNAVQGFVILIAVIYVGLNLVIDLAYGVVDPRIRLG